MILREGCMVLDQSNRIGIRTRIRTRGSISTDAPIIIERFEATFASNNKSYRYMRNKNEPFSIDLEVFDERKFSGSSTIRLELHYASSNSSAGNIINI
ncbi:hypothetical protein V1478_004305 [Vespula squamosa]|uniref:Uncharacterized protein n=1 Tax=Vespula squamosa TaxID=30214 RepID=A0ABD2BHE6_VESSQ